MYAIVNVDLDWAIGKDGDLINHFKEDMMFFRNKTSKATVIYGRKTLESFPNGAPLKGRKNIVISSNVSKISEDAKLMCNYFGCIDYSKLSNMCLMSTMVKNDPRNVKTPKDGNTVLIATTDTDKAVDISKVIGKSDEVFVIGGASIYKQMLPYCDKVFVTRCYNHTPGADSFFPNLDELDDWDIISRDGKTVSDNGTQYEFMVYGRKEK